MPEWLVGIAAPLLVILGYFLRPLGELSADVVRDRRAIRQRRDQLQQETLTGLTTSLEAWRVASHGLGPTLDRVEAQEHVRALAFRVRDDDLRGLLERLLAAPTGPDSEAVHGDVMRRLGEVIREL